MHISTRHTRLLFAQLPPSFRQLTLSVAPDFFLKTCKEDKYAQCRWNNKHLKTLSSSLHSSNNNRNRSNHNRNRN